MFSKIIIFIFLPCFFVQLAQGRSVSHLQKALREAIESDDIRIARGLLEAGANANDLSGWGLLHSVQSTQMAKLLMNAGASVNAPNSYGSTPLYYTIRSPELTELFVNAGVTDLNAKNKKGNTILHDVESTEVAEILINAGADVNVKNKRGETSLQNNRFVREAVSLINLKKRQDFLAIEPSLSDLSCQYVAGFSKIRAVQCGRRDLCIGEVSCSFEVGIAKDTIPITQTYQAFCEAPSNGKCPLPADDCVLDQSVVEEKASLDSTLGSPINRESPRRKRRRGTR